MMVPTNPDDPLVDRALAEEIALLGEVIAAAATAVGRTLSQAEIDAALGLCGGEPEGGVPEPEGGASPCRDRPVLR